MTTEQIWSLVTAPDPLDPVFEHLTQEIWTSAAFSAAETAGRLAQYLSDHEHAASQFERTVYDIYADLYGQLEGAHSRKQRLEQQVFDRDAFTLVIFDALSLREIPAVAGVMAEAGLVPEISYGLSGTPSETVVFAKAHFNANGPSAIADEPLVPPAAFRHVKKKDWQPDFKPGDRRRVVWALYPDNLFNLDHGAIDYGADIVAPVQQILRSILASDPVYPVIVTSDHGYLWQGGQAAWPVDGDEAGVLAKHFKQGRCTGEATIELRTRTDKAWLSGQDAAARGRFAWGGKVAGAIKLYKHGGVSFMECLTPWVTGPGGQR